MRDERFNAFLTDTLHVVEKPVSFFYRQLKFKENKMSRNKRYGCLPFIVDCALTLFTGGLWLIWVFVRESRRSR